MAEHYPTEVLSEDDDDGTMPDNVAALSEAVVGHRIVSVEPGASAKVKPYESMPDYETTITGHAIVLDDGTRVILAPGGDCCAYTDLEAFLLHPEMVDHIITGVGTEGGYTTWHIYADMGDVLDLTVGWSAGNPFYYGYGFNIAVVPA